MQGAVLYGPGDVRFEERPAPTIVKPTDAVIRLSATCVCGSDLWPYRGIQGVTEPTPMGHEYCGVVEEVGSPLDTPRFRRWTNASVTTRPAASTSVVCAGLRGSPASIAGRWGSHG